MYNDRNSIWRWLFLGVLIGCVLFLILAKTERAEAAYTDDGFFYPDLSTDVDYGIYQDVVSDIIERNNYLLVIKSPDSYLCFFKKDITFAFDDNDINKPSCKILTDDYIRVCDGVVVEIREGSIAGGNVFYHYYQDDLSVVGSNFDYRGDSSINQPYCNLSYPLNLRTNVDIEINGLIYTISESLNYYLALKETDGSIRLFFSDVPFTGDDVDLYTRGFYADVTSTIVTYYWDATEQNSFLNSRMVLSGPFFQPYSYLTNSMADYISNYHVFKTSSLLDIYLPEKLYFTSPEDSLTVEDLFKVMPDELYNYNYCIVFRQQSPAAYDDRIIFYGWNETSANLYIKKKNSQIAALTNKSVVSDYVTAYYDPDFGTWVISDDIVLGATRDASFNLPKIYHSDVDLFVCDEWREWDYVGYMGDANRPIVSFEEPDEDDTLLSRLFNGLSKLLKNLFVPSSGFLNSKVNYMKSKFSFYESISNTVDTIKDFFVTTDFTEPPSISVDLSKSRSKYNYGDTAVCLDMSWYEEYKPAVDTFLSAVIWLVFIWNTFRNLPNIIAGIAAGGNVTTTIIKDSEPQPSAISRNAMKEGKTYSRGL